MTDKEITIKDIQAIKSLTIPIPAGGGIVLLRGGQGTGKSTAVKAVSRALGNDRIKLSARDGKAKGKLEFGQVRMTVGARTTIKGELEVEEIESRLDLPALVDPGIAKPDRADAARIKALVALSGVEAKPTDYHELMGGQEQFERLGVDTDTDDPLLLASRVKAAIEKQAQRWHRNAETCKKHAAAAAEQAQGVDLEAPHDAQELQQAYDAARDELTAMTEKAKAAASVEESMAVACLQLKKREKEYEGPTPEEAARDAEDAERVYLDQVETRKELEQELEKVKRQEEQDQLKLRHAREIEKTAKSHAETVAHLQQLMNQAVPECPTDDEAVEAQAKVEAAFQAIETGATVRDAIEASQKAAEQNKNAAEADRFAEMWRERAAEVESVLTDLLPKSALRIEAGRLVTETDRSKSELFADLSEGERWIMAINLAADFLPDGGILCVDQQGFEGLQPANKRAIHEAAKARGVTILAPVATDDELHAEHFESTS